MKERPILFSGPMVQAILDGRKTQTRRLVRIDDSPVFDRTVDFERRRGTARGLPTNAQNVRMCGLYAKCDSPPGSNTVSSRVFCPYGAPGDRLWVRETWLQLEPDHRAERFGPAPMRCDGVGPFGVVYRASYRSDFDGERCRRELGYAWRPSIHMPRWASRITLEITEVRVERLQQISDGGARAEGMECRSDLAWFDAVGAADPYAVAVSLGHRAAFRETWDSINGKRAPWSSNPWVWVVSFRRIDP